MTALSAGTMLTANIRLERPRARGGIPSITNALANMPKGAQPKVTVNDADVPLEALAVSRSANPGKHVVVVKLEGQLPKKSAFELAEREAHVVTVDLAPDPVTDAAKPTLPTGGTVVTNTPSPPTPGGQADPGAGTSSGSSSLIGVGGAGLLIGGVTGMIAFGKDSSIKSNCPNQGCPPALHDDLDAAKRYSTISTIGFGVGIVGLGVGVWGLLSSPTPQATKPPSAASVQPWVGAGTTGIMGAF